VVQHSRDDRLVVGIAFFSFAVMGTPGALLNVAWSPSIRDTFHLALDAVGALLLAGTLGYAVASSISGRLTAHMGVARLLATSTVLGALGLLGMALAPAWRVMVVSGLLLGMGAGGLDGAMNIFFAANYGPRLMNWLHASFGIGATLAPLAMTAILQGGGSWRLGYGLAVLLFGMVTVLFVVTRGRWRLASGSASSAKARIAPVGETLRLPLVWLGIALFLACTGLEVSAGQWSFSLLTESRHLAPEIAGLWVSVYWGSFTIGRLFFGAAVHWIRPVVLLRGCMAGALLGAAWLGWRPLAGAGSLGLALFGFSIAPIFALMISDTQERLGPVHAPNAIGLQVAAAAIGGGALPGLAGVLAKNLGLEVIPPFLLAVTLTMILLIEAIHRPRIAVVAPDRG
jgi:fucose permease